MTTKPSGDPARQLTREDVDRLGADMLAAEPDWASRCALLVSALQTATLRLADYQGASHFQGVIDEYHRDLAAWQNAADVYYAAVGSDVAESLPLDDEDG